MTCDPRTPQPPKRRRLATSGWLALLLAGLAGATTAPAPPLDPEQTVTGFYELMQEGRCAEAQALRPDQDSGQCAGFSLIQIHAQAWGTLGELALVHLDAHYRLGEAERRDVGCVVLHRDPTGWRWQAFVAQPCEVIATDEARREAPAGGEPSPSGAAPADLPADALTPPAGPTGAAAANLIVPALVPQPTPPVLAPIPPGDAEAPPPVPPDAAGPGPAATLAAYYAAHNASDCATVARLRPGYQGCGAFRAVELSQVEPRLSSPQAGISVLGFEVSYVPREATSETVRERLAGLAWLERGPDGWHVLQIDDQAQFATVQARFDKRLRQAAGAGGPALPTPPDAPLRASPTTPLPVPPTVPDVATLRRSPAAPDGVPPAIGAACWSPKELVGSLAEATSRHQRPPGGTPPPAHLIEQATAARGPWGAGLRGSIRWVDLADPNGRLIALTFDLCEQANEITGYDAAIVDYLRENKVAATFFAGGKWMQSHPERAQQLLADPNFEVGNHAWTHGNLRVLKGRELREQILWTQAEAQVQRDALAARCPATAAATPAVFRFPYGTCSPEALDTLAEFGLAAVQWDIVSGDPARGQTADGIERAVRARLKPGRGHIVVMHANGRGRATAAALHRLIPDLRQQGWRFVTVSTLLRAGTPHAVSECYELKPDDNARYDRLFGRGTGD